METINTWMLAQYVAVTEAVRDALRREEGQDFAEYALIFALVVIVAVVGFYGLGDKIKTAMTGVTAQF